MKSQNTNVSRRSLLTASAFGATAAMLPAIPALGQASASVPKGGVILFQGDSITDAGRNRGRQGNANDQSALGNGYPLFISAYLLATQPQLELKCYNRGISGHKVPDLDARWQADTIDLKPNLLSILIGVNDIWHKLNGNYNGTVKDYDQQLAALLERTKKALPETKIVLCEPFVLKCGAVNDSWFPEFSERLQAARRVGKAAGATMVSFQTMFDNLVAEGTEPSYWAGDGVHPSLPGHMRMAVEWLETVSAG